MKSLSENILTGSLGMAFILRNWLAVFMFFLGEVQKVSLIGEMSALLSAGLFFALYFLFHKTRHQHAQTKTELAQIHDELHQTQLQYATLTATIPLGIFCTDLTGNYLSVNDYWSQITGLSVEEVKGRSWLHLIHPDDRDRILTQWQQTQNQPYQAEFRVQHPDGRTLWIFSQMVFQADEQIYLGFMTDITPYKQTETALHHSEQRYANLMEAVPVGIYQTDAQGNNLYHNQRWCQITGLTVEASQGTGWLKGIYPEDRDRVFAHWYHCVNTHTLFYSEHRLQHPNGKVTWVLAQTVAEYDETGTLIGYIGTLTDITERKLTETQLREINQKLEALIQYRQQAEAELKQARDELEFHVQARTQELIATNSALQAEIAERQEAQNQLERLTQELQRSNEDLEQFAYIASHDLQEPLRAVAGYSQLLLKEYQNRFDEPAYQYMDYIIDGAKRMQQLIQDLLAYSRVNTRGQPFALTPCSEVLERVCNHLKVAIAESQAEITSDPLPTVKADKIQLIHLFQNLISNAIKFHRPHCPPQIHIGAELQNQHWRFTVRDNGIGIKPQYLGRIFVIFKRLHTRREYPGTGIGLAICKKIVERHGGQIWADSEFGIGTTFYFTLPGLETQHQDCS